MTWHLDIGPFQVDAFSVVMTFTVLVMIWAVVTMRRMPSKPSQVALDKAEAAHLLATQQQLKLLDQQLDELTGETWRGEMQWGWPPEEKPSRTHAERLRARGEAMTAIPDAPRFVDGVTPITAASLNAMTQRIDELDQAVRAMYLTPQHYFGAGPVVYLEPGEVVVPLHPGRYFATSYAPSCNVDPVYGWDGNG